MFAIPLTCTTRRFDPIHGALLEKQQPLDLLPAASYTSVIDVCNALILPLPYISQLVRSGQEAKVLVECSLTAQKLKLLWYILQIINFIRPCLTTAITSFYLHLSQGDASVSNNNPQQIQLLAPPSTEQAPLYLVQSRKFLPTICLHL